MLTWGEFVEANWLREYRRTHNVPLQHLRKFIDLLRERQGVSYPLAHSQPFVGVGRKLVLELQGEAGLPTAYLLVAPVGGQIVLLPPAESFLSKVEFSTDAEEWVERIRPNGKRSPVVLDPKYSFGEPTVRGIRTNALAELVEAGEPMEEVATQYGLKLSHLKAALSYKLHKLLTGFVPVRFYVDADTLGLAHILCRLRGDVTYPGDPGGTVKKQSRPPCPITDPETDDDIWIPIVARSGWLIITRDQAIRQKPTEIAAVRSSGAGMVAIVASSPTEALNNFGILEIFMINWRKIEPLVGLPGPFIFTASRSTFARVV